MIEQEQRDAVLAEAATWIGTKHHNGARLKGVGVDCGQFPLAVYEAAGLLPHIVPDRYPPDFHLTATANGTKKSPTQTGKGLKASQSQQILCFTRSGGFTATARLSLNGRRSSMPISASA